MARQFRAAEKSLAEVERQLLSISSLHPLQCSEAAVPAEVAGDTCSMSPYLALNRVGREWSTGALHRTKLVAAFFREELRLYYEAQERGNVAGGANVAAHSDPPGISGGEGLLAPKLEDCALVGM